MRKTFSIPNKKQNKINDIDIKTQTNRTSSKNTKEKKHSKIFNYDGLKSAIFKHNSFKLEKKI